MEDEELFDAYRDETTEQCETCEEILLGVKDGVVTRPMMDNLFRIAHTIKGSGMGLGIERLPDFVHHWEDILTKTREAEFPIVLPVEALSLFLECNDAVREFIEQYPDNAEHWVAHFSILRGRLTELYGGALTDIIKNGSATTPEPAAPDSPVPDSPAPLAEAAIVTPAPPQTPPGEVSVVPEKSAEPVPTPQQPAPPKHPATAPASPSPRNPPNSGGGHDGPPAPSAKKSGGSEGSNETIRVRLDRIDLLIQRIGELAVQQQLIGSRLLDLTDDPVLEADSRKLGQLCSEAHDIAMSLRMVPIQPAIRSLRRTCRDTALKLKKKVNFQTVGEGAEIDLALIQTTSDALVHLIRNAVDHGIETAEERTKTTKSEIATVNLSVAQRGGHLEIEVTDDGRGLDSDRIRQKAVKQGMLGPDDTPTEETLYGFLFHPGFSTTQKVTEFSGRGVGLDVVATSIATLDGNISVQSNLGYGTSFLIQVPLSVAVVDVMHIEIDKEPYLVPLHTIQETVAVSDELLQSTAAGASTVMLLRGNPVPVHMLKSVLRGDRSKPKIDREHTSALITQHRSQPIAFGVDNIIGRQQVVIKPLGPELIHIHGISGSAILGDGRVGLILDLPSLITSRALAA